MTSPPHSCPNCSAATPFFLATAHQPGGTHEELDWEQSRKPPVGIWSRSFPVACKPGAGLNGFVSHCIDVRTCGVNLEEYLRLMWDSGTLMLMLGTFFLSITLLSVKLLAHSVAVFQLIVIRSAFSCLLLAPWARFLKVSLLGPYRLWPILAARGLSGAISMSLVVASLYLIPLADTIILLSSHPVWTAAACWLFDFEPINIVMQFGIFVCISGVIMVSHPPFLLGGHKDWADKRIAGVSMGLAASLFTTVAVLLVAKIGKTVKAFTLTMWFQLCAFCLSLPIMLAGFPSKMNWQQDPQDIVWLVVLSVSSLVSQTLVNRGLQLVSASKGGILLMLQIPFTTLWAMVLLDESLTLSGAGGILLIALGVFLVSNGQEVIKYLRDVSREDSFHFLLGRYPNQAPWSITPKREGQLPLSETKPLMLGRHCAAGGKDAESLMPGTNK